jgi:hypothetical protein
MVMGRCLGIDNTLTVVSWKLSTQNWFVRSIDVSLRIQHEAPSWDGGAWLLSGL